MNIQKRWMLAVTLVVCSTWAAIAQGAAPRFEIAPSAGYRIGGSFDLEDQQGARLGSVDLDAGYSWGVGLALYRDTGAFYELLYSRQATGLDGGGAELGGLDVTTEYLQFGGTLVFDNQSSVRPYVSLTLGLTRLDAEGFKSEYEPSGSLGLGLRVPAGERVSLILGARGYATLVASDLEIACESVSGDAACLVRYSGDVLLQWEASLGIAFAF